MKIVSPSLLSANFLNLEKDIQMLNESEAQWFHIDVMDGVYVPNISFGFPILEQVRKATTKVLDVHLMIVNPDQYIERFAAAGADYLTVHAEASTHLHRTVQSIKAASMKAGIALNPHTPLSTIEELVGHADMILLMSVNPGFAAQSFIETTYNRIKRLRKMIDDAGSSCIIQVDGGVSTSNIAALYEAGCDCVVAGNAVFKSSDPKATISKLIKG